MEILISIVAKVAELLVVPIKRQIGYVLDCNTNIQNLRNEVEKLTDAKTRVIHSIEEARRNGEEIEVDVENWLRSVDGVIQGGGGVVGDESSKKCFMGLCPDLKIRYRLGKAAKKELTVIADLQEKGKFDGVSYRAAPSGIGPVKDYEAFESRDSVVNAIVDALKDGAVSMVGVYGMGGLGKTTLVLKVAEQVKEGRLFDKVVLALVSQTPDIRRIQGEIADGLGLKLDAETDKGRASQLCEGLKKVTCKRPETETMRVLVILDDIWKELKLEDVGIPHEGCKILMSSRNEYVLSREMGANKNFPIQFLPANEAWNFFEKMVGVTVKNPSLQLVAAEVAKRCAGLPILLATVARALKNKDLYAWKDALTQLKRFDKDEIDKRVYSCLELSYIALRGDEIKSLFLLCGQLRSNNILISNLLRYGIGLDLFKGRSTLEETRNRLHTLVDELKASCLLLEGDNDGSVKMHDVVHSFAISVASRDHHVLVVADELKEWPANDVLQQYTGISLPYREIPDLPAILECPNLRSFILLNKDHSLQIPDNFFREMKELKVLGLTAVNLSPLPSSLQFLENLQTLCLDHCVLEDISIVGELKKLQVLSLNSSNLKGNPLLKHIRNVKWAFADVVCDYLLGQSSCALYLSLRYHLLHPDYLYYRIRELQKNCKLRVVLCHVDVEDVVKPLLEVTKTALLHDCTLLCAWRCAAYSNANGLEECGRYLETIKMYENKPADLIQGQMDTDYSSRLHHALTTVRRVNKTDVVTLGSTFGSLSNIMDASMEDLARCPGIGERKVKRLYDTFHEPFKRVVSSHPVVPQTPVQKDTEPSSVNEVAEMEMEEANANKRRKKEPELTVKSALSSAFAKCATNKLGNKKFQGEKVGETSTAIDLEAETRKTSG
ncbi:disease resistance gene NBS-LRR family protein [Populus alba x Populus x berolinensis]|nr:disease resistance gene NBS-LRR family protein [Populus alba x Populus x berolinensis]